MRKDNERGRRREDEKRKGEKVVLKGQHGPFEYGKLEGQCPSREDGSKE